MTTTATTATTSPATRTPKHDVGNDEFAGFAHRIIRALTRRIGDGDIEGMRDLVALAELAEFGAAEAAQTLVANGYSWGDIGRSLGITRQSAHERFRART